MSNQFEAFGAFGMIPLSDRAISLASLSMVEMVDAGAMTLTLVGGKEVVLNPDQAAEMMAIINNAFRELKTAQARQAMAGSSLILPKTH